MDGNALSASNKNRLLLHVITSQPYDSLNETKLNMPPEKCFHCWLKFSPKIQPNPLRVPSRIRSPNDRCDS